MANPSISYNNTNVFNNHKAKKKQNKKYYEILKKDIIFPNRLIMRFNIPRRGPKAAIISCMLDRSALLIVRVNKIIGTKTKMNIKMPIMRFNKPLKGS